MKDGNRKNGSKTGVRDAGGKFALGNPGRPKGAKHKTTLAVEALLEGEAEALTRAAIEKALEGDVTALRLCMDRIAPARKDSPVTFDLPEMTNARDAATTAQSVLAAVAGGEVTPLEGAAVMGLIETYRKTLETSELEERITALEGAGR